MREKALARLADEKKAEQIKVGLKRQEAVTILGSPCKVEDPMGTGRRVLSFDSLSTAFELDGMM